MIFQLVLDDTADADLINWISRQPANRKSAAVRHKLRSAIEQENITLADVYEAVMELKRQAVTIGPAPEQPNTLDDPELTNNIDKLLKL